MHKTLSLLAAALCFVAPVSAAQRPVVLDVGRSRLEIGVKANVAHFTAKVAPFQADVTVDNQSGTPMTAVVHFPFTAVATGNAARDKEMNAWEQSATYPEVSFTLARVSPAGAGKFDAEGRLALHGVEHVVRFPVSVTLAATRVTIDGQAEVDTRDFNLPVIKKYLVLKVDPRLQVDFHLEGALSSQ